MGIQQILAYAKKERDTVKGAPFVFVILACMAAVAGYSVATHEERGHEQSLSDQLNLEKQGRANEKSQLEQRIASKDDQLSDYRSKLLIAELKVVPSASQSARVSETQRQLYKAATRFSNASNMELVKLAGKLASEIFGLAKKAEEPLNQNPANGEAFRKALIDANFEYASKYQADAMVLRDEILSRLPLVQRPTWNDSMYEHPTNTFGLETVASDLDRLANMLPLK